MKKIIGLFILFHFVFPHATISQVGINDDGSSPDPSAGLEVKFENKGFLMPRMTTSQIYYIDNPAMGLIAFNIDSLDFWYFDGTWWIGIIDHSDTLVPSQWYCGIDLIYQGQNYPTLWIDTLCWMARNLNTAKYRTGEIIPNVTDASTWENLSNGARCYYNNDSLTNAAEYGALYNWYVVDCRNICPTGWHVPTDAEWSGLATYLGGTSVAGGKMKETGTTHWNSPNTGADNSSGFNGLPGGIRLWDYLSLKDYGYWWSSTASGSTAWHRYLATDSEALTRMNNWGLKCGMSVRCVLNNYANRPPATPSNPTPYNNSINQYLDITLSWICTEPDGDSLSYNVYLDTISSPAVLAAENIIVNSFSIPDELLSGKTYYWKIVASDNYFNTSEGPVWNFTTTPSGGIGGGPCPDVPSVNYWGESYTTVRLGTMCWLGQNLRTFKYQNGDLIPNVTDQTGWFNLTSGARCYYDNDSNTYHSEYGALYNAIAARDSRNLCPPDWHVPSDAEWTALVNYLGGDYIAGGRMKETGTDHWWEPNIGATNESGLTALPGGVRNGIGFEFFGTSAFWWTSTIYSGVYIWYYIVSGDGPPTYRQWWYGEKAAMSVRCIWDHEVNVAPAEPSNPDPADNSTGVELGITLSWSCTDPENDPMTYDVYFGISTDPTALAADDITVPYFDIPYSLVPETTYYWKVIAADDHSHFSEGAVWDFTTRDWLCGDNLLYEGQFSRTVEIGTQCWMAENLNVGNQISGVTPQSNNSIIEKHCYNNVSDSCSIYGGLYQWDEMMNYSISLGAQGICPVGWHIPEASEWDVLSAYLGGSSVAGGHIKETGYRHWKSPNTGATNSSGFSAYGGGTYRPSPYNYFYLIQEGGIYWTSNPSGAWAIRRDLSYLDATLGPYTCERNHSFSVRCMKN